MKGLRINQLETFFLLIIVCVYVAFVSCNSSSRNEAIRQGIKGGPPPDGMPPRGGMNNNFDISLIKAACMAKTENMEKKQETIEASGENQSAVVAFNNTKVVLKDNRIITSGNTSSNDQSSFQGLNAAILSRDQSTITSSDNFIKTTGIGANGIFAYGKSVIHTNNDTIDCYGGGGHGIMTSGGGTIHSKNVYIITRGQNSGAVATDRGSGIITVDGGFVKATGDDSPGIYSTGKITSNGVTYEATGAEVAVIEGSNSITCNNCELLYDYQNKWGVMIYQSFSGDAEGVDGHYEMNGGSLKSTDKTGPLFFVTNSNANIYLKSVTIETASGILLNASATNRWGNTGSNGGNANIYASTQKLNGKITADNISAVVLELKEKSEFKGSINTEKTAKTVNVSIDESSKWYLTDDSYVDIVRVNISNTEVLNIIGNGYTLWYNKDKNPELEGKIYLLKNKGELKPYKR